ncbi:hypothetical protein MPTK1_3g05300 [Marchantia polymorpha subsp. ruderalis]|uniref:Uncharacterized protein n=2 Tax=Marchantia polymorpha TaxID=3197 RepID=A0AAF6AXM6_MARPO|nr:hypothetical protein MARPO_0006s0003 [Marchantia polymorpha]PTQ47946.1 hypothetical protein MARPO_0006s0003 [Marchantia polymorpha]BBN04509.1 hypothetical protein Mp_3g05300 [Marchantia polymorpha subsp. ruderalis]BBN04510.1 hypothetical protein Mp_3g05300 [Marchantia polymorpha subsp. ruderalis]|eukprot:PTQ47945.1 hypothetical protein MARPO_0006s0003 [Marchantia polymorpha]
MVECRNRDLASRRFGKHYCLLIGSDFVTHFRIGRYSEVCSMDIGGILNRTIMHGRFLDESFLSKRALSLSFSGLISRALKVHVATLVWNQRIVDLKYVF